MIRFRRFLYRERRRLALVASLITVAAFLVLTNNLGQPDVRYEALSALAIGVGAATVALLLILISPEWRHAADTTALASFFYSVILVRMKDFDVAAPGHLILAFVGFLVLAAFLHVIFFGTWSDRLLRLRHHVERATCLTGLDAQTAWSAAVPVPGGESHYWDSTVKGITEVEGDPNRVILFRQFDNGLMQQQLLHFDQVRYGQSFRYTYQTLGARYPDRKLFALVLEERRDGVAVHLRWERSDYPLRQALMHWIDDWAGRAGDRHIAWVEDRQRMTIEPQLLEAV